MVRGNLVITAAGSRSQWCSLSAFVGNYRKARGCLILGCDIDKGRK